MMHKSLRISTVYKSSSAHKCHIRLPLLQDKDASIAKLQADIHELGLKCEAASAQAEVSQPYEQRYREAQVCFQVCHAFD